jgi:peptidyl-prolyl cis-trans isomerase B (cyclophilin B)
MSTFNSLLLLGLVPSADAGAGNPKVRLKTTKGDIVIELDKAHAPKTVENFLSYAKSGHYEGTIFHRVIAGFMIQGGGLDEGMRQKPTNPPVINEADNGLKNDRGTIAMARTNDPNSATSQFFINTVDNAFLNFKAKTASGWGYCVFGKVVEGMDVVDAIEKVSTGNKGMHGDVPVTPVLITSAAVEE